VQDTVNRTPTEAQAARARRCALCEKPPGVPCQAKPEADHLARFLDAYVAGKLSRAYLAAVVGELVVIDRAVMIPAVAS
jgi:hypothetical protein